MAIETVKYLRKPLYVDAVRITSANFDDVVEWCQGEVLQDDVPGKGVTKKYIKVRVHNPKNARQTKAFVGDWLLYTARGYKVYTNKAFHASFDQVNEVEGEGESNYPLFYIDPTNGWLTDQPPHEGAEPLSFDELMTCVSKEVTSEARYERMEREHKLQAVGSTPSVISKSGEEVEVAPGVTMSQGMQQDVAHLTPLQTIRAMEAEGRPISTVRDQIRQLQSEDMTMEDIGKALGLDVSIVRSIENNGRVTVISGEAQNVDDVATNHREKIPAVAAEGKRVLSIAEQKELTADQIRELVQAGDAVLAQDLPAA